MTTHEQISLSQPPETTEVELPKTLDNGRYIIKNVVGKGGMAEILLAIDTKMDRPVALKRVAINMYPVKNITNAQSNILQEAKTLASVMDTVRIVTVFDFITENGSGYIVMEYLHPDEYIFLEDLVFFNRHKLNWNIVRIILEQFSSTADVMLKKGVLHRDLKPKNIAIGHNGIKIIDFGVADTVLKDQEDVGTPEYMAPERLLAIKNRIGLPAEVFSMGTILYEILTGQNPFLDSDELKTVANILQNDSYLPEIVKLANIYFENENDKDTFINFFKKIFHIDSKKRFQTCTEAYEAFVPIMEKLEENGFEFK